MAVRELVPEGDEAAEAEAAQFFDDLLHIGVLSQFILYSAEDLRRFRDLVARGVVPGHRHSVLFVLGRYAEGGSKVSDLDPFLAEGTDRLTWMVCAFGAEENAIMQAAIAAGGHCRVGFENNLLLADGTTAPDNAALVGEVADAVRRSGRRPACPDIARALFS